MRKLTMLVAAMSLLVASGCKKKEETTDSPPEAAKGTEDKPADPAKGEDKPAQPADDSSDVVAQFTACSKAWSERKVDELRACYHDGVISETAGMPEMKTEGVDAVIAMAEGFWKTFPDMQTRDMLVLVHGNDVVSLTSGGGTMKGALVMGPGNEIPATGKKMGGIGIQKFTFDAGKIKAELGFWDMGQMMGQISGQEGVRPAMDVQASIEDNPIVSGDTDVEKANLELLAKHAEDFNTKDAAGIAEMYAADAVLYDSGSPANYEGNEAIAGFFGFLKTAMPDIKIEAKEAWAAGDYVYVQLTLTGTNTGPMPPMLSEPTGKSVNLPLGEIYRFKDGKITHQWVIANGVTFAGQLGLLPDEAAATK